MDGVIITSCAAGKTSEEVCCAAHREEDVRAVDGGDVDTAARERLQDGLHDERDVVAQVQALRHVHRLADVHVRHRRLQAHTRMVQTARLGRSSSRPYADMLDP